MRDFITHKWNTVKQRLSLFRETIGSSFSNFLFRKATSEIRQDRSSLCHVQFWTLPRAEPLQPLQATCSTAVLSPQRWWFSWCPAWSFLVSSYASCLFCCLPHMYNMKSPVPSACCPTVKSWGAAGRTPKPSLQAEQVLQPQLTGQVTRPWPAWWLSPAHPFYPCLSCIGRLLELGSLLQMCKHCIKRDNPFPPSTGHAFIDPPQAAASSFHCQGTLLAHAQLSGCQHPRAFSTELLSSQVLLFIYPPLQNPNLQTKIPTAKSQLTNKNIVEIVLFVVKTEKRAGDPRICCFQPIQFLLHYK